MTREQIVGEIKRTAEANGGVPLGFQRFRAETGIRKSDWYGVYWVRWGDALRDAGYAPNAWQVAYSEQYLIDKFIELLRELGKFPLEGDLRIKCRQVASFPSHTTFTKLGSKAQRVDRLIAHSSGLPGYEDVLAICSAAKLVTRSAADPDASRGGKVVLGYVYLLRDGRHYKIGKSKAFGRRERELAIQLPSRAQTVHVIRTDDPAGIEEYWHKRFAAKRGNGEWFDLDAADVKAFKRRKYM